VLYSIQAEGETEIPREEHTMVGSDFIIKINERNDFVYAIDEPFGGEFTVKRIHLKNDGTAERSYFVSHKRYKTYGWALNAAKREAKRLGWTVAE
jgi:hypothetical protein